jgi:hypothetical protein
MHRNFTLVTSDPLHRFTLVVNNVPFVATYRVSTATTPSINHFTIRPASSKQTSILWQQPDEKIAAQYTWHEAEQVPEIVKDFNGSILAIRVAETGCCTRKTIFESKDCRVKLHPKQTSWVNGTHTFVVEPDHYEIKFAINNNHFVVVLENNNGALKPVRATTEYRYKS